MRSTYCYLSFDLCAATPLGSNHDITARWAGSAAIPVSSRSRLGNSPTGSPLPPPPSYQAATAMMSPASKHPSHVQHPRHHQIQQRRASVTSPHVPVRSSLPAPPVVPAVAAHDRKMSFQFDCSTWKDREPTHFRWNMMPVAKTTDQQQFHHTLPTSYDEVTTTVDYHYEICGGVSDTIYDPRRG